MTRKRLVLLAAAAAIFGAQAMPATSGETGCRNASDAKASVVEMVTYGLTKDTSVEQHLKAAAATNSFLCGQPGFVRRTLVKGEDGLWRDTLEWASLEEAHTAAAKAMQEPALVPFMQSIDPEQVTVRYGQISLAFAAADMAGQ